jgi:small neutral amino acid transporter SnatA (MarC family)
MPVAVGDTCPAVHFLVPMFTMPALDGNSTTSAYHHASDAAHIILGVLLLLMVAAWASFVMELLRIRAASRLSGICQTLMGGSYAETAHRERFS